jgi:hypothetical protein
MLWLPPRTASIDPSSAANRTVRATSPALVARTTSAGHWSCTAL